MKKLIAAFIAVALVSSALSYGILKLQQNSQAPTCNSETVLASQDNFRDLLSQTLQKALCSVNTGLFGTE
jgi:uncharacterized secreted protein with C-terminal beta-propeller domain